MEPKMIPEIRDWFVRNGDLSPKAREQLDELQIQIANVASLAVGYVPPCPDRDKALEHLRSASMWFGTALAGRGSK
jgi:hypothetical protein